MIHDHGGYIGSSDHSRIAIVRESYMCDVILHKNYSHQQYAVVRPTQEIENRRLQQKQRSTEELSYLLFKIDILDTNIRYCSTGLSLHFSRLWMCFHTCISNV